MQKKKKVPIFKRDLKLIPLVILGIILSFYASCTINRLDVNTEFTGIEPSQIKRYFLKQRIWTLRDQFIIKNEFRESVFQVKGKIFSLGDKLRFLDLKGRELIYIKQKLFSFSHLYRLYRGKRLYARVWKRFTLFKNKFIIDIAGPDDYVVRGNFLSYRYNIFRAGRRVAVISKKWPAWTDHYKIEIIPGEDDLLILASAIVIDMVSHRDEHHAFAGY